MTVDLNTHMIVEKALEESARPESPGSVQKPNEQDISAFQESLEGADSQVQADSAPEGLPKAKPAPESESSGSLGDAILRGMQSVQESHETQEKKINDLVSQPNLDTRDLMMLQYEVAQLTITEEAASKIANKTGEGVQTLFKNQ